jgi:alkaline phosphatase D
MAFIGLAGVLLAFTSAFAGPFQANGIKIGEVDQTRVIVWTRLTTVETGDYTVAAGAPGSDGEVRVELWPQDNPTAATNQGWQAVDATADYTRQFVFTGLTPGTQYALRCDSRPSGGGPVSSSIEGAFSTAPSVNQAVPVLFTAVTGQGLVTIDAGTNGFLTYREMTKLDPSFFVHTGDVLYYDKQRPGEPFGDSPGKAYQKWNRMFSLDYNKDFYRQIPSYFIKDDHDTLKNDCYAGQTYGSLTFAKGVEIFHQETPSGPSRYRTIRWGKDLQIWLPENREYRNANGDPDGPSKTIWGSAQKAWFTNTVAASDAAIKLLVSPGAVVGPDKPNKKDNHANEGFQTEGDWLRTFIGAQSNLFVICGDRHWQYASIDPSTGVREYCTGAINKEHAAIGGGPGYDITMHSFYAVRGGFLSVLVDRQSNQPQVTFSWHDIDDVDPETGDARITYQETLRPQGFGLTTITTDHVAGDVAIQFMSRMGHEYRVEASTNLVDWMTVTNGLNARGSLIEYQRKLDLDQYAKRFYRVVEMDPSLAPSFTVDPINDSATVDIAYTGSVANATDPNGDTLSYSKLTGPAWLSVGTDGSLSGTPAPSDQGANVFTVQVDDGTDGTDTATLDITVVGPPVAGVVYHDTFGNDGLAVNTGTGGGLIAVRAEDAGAGDGTIWSDAGVGLTVSTTAGGDRTAAATINAFNLSEGFTLSVAWTSLGSAEPISFALSPEQWTTMDDPTGSAIQDPLGYYANRYVASTFDIKSMGLQAGDKNRVQGLYINEGSGVQAQRILLEASTVAAGAHTFSLTVGANNVYSYILDGAAALTGTTTFDLSQPLYFNAYSQATTTTITEIRVVATSDLDPEPTNNAPRFTSDPIYEIAATEDAAYSSTLADDASDPEGDPMTSPSRRFPDPDRPG